MLPVVSLAKEIQILGSERTQYLIHRDPGSRIEADSQERILTCAAAHTCTHALTHTDMHTHTDTHTNESQTNNKTENQTRKTEFSKNDSIP